MDDGVYVEAQNVNVSWQAEAALRWADRELGGDDGGQKSRVSQEQQEEKAK